MLRILADRFFSRLKTNKQSDASTSNAALAMACSSVQTCDTSFIVRVNLSFAADSDYSVFEADSLLTNCEIIMLIGKA